nr:immunoglobulin heavy chain junction region [Macaca mulatta]MOW18858.1 immunoglobulin heavy chain junction region [Macaca mulatta]MOW18879.1 immunoglobulin heavy chain junction region [Macaca mulatta]MOW18907.1 immunoglobulin heavy chain junction region [Macaca mulatta]MOW18965.1 immunoglobulin heavy chain junction region [Macaca mulatta]
CCRGGYSGVYYSESLDVW